MDGQPQPTSLRDQAASCVQQLQQLKQRTEKGLQSHKSDSTQTLLKSVADDVKNSLRNLQAWISQLEQGKQADNPSIVAIVEERFDRLGSHISEALAALNSRLWYRKLLVVGFIKHKRLGFIASVSCHT